MLKKVIPLVIVPLVLLLWARLGAQSLALYSFNALVKYPSPYLGAIAPGKEGEPLTQQLVLVVVDALRADASRTMPNLNTLRTRGADRTAQVGQPSFSLPGWTVIGTGAWQEQSGVTLNFYDSDIKVDTIFQAAKRKGLTTAIIGEGSGWKQLYPRGVDVNIGTKGVENPYIHLAAVRREDDEIEAAALKVLKENKPNLVLIHFIEPDDAGHGQGAASDAYKQAILAEDARIGRLVSALDLSRASLVVTGDHGQLDRGGHGGGEPEVLTVPIVAAGQAIKPGQYAPSTQADIAPTIATLLGTSFPAHNQGLPLFDMLTMPADLRARRAVDAAEELNSRYAQVAQVVGAPAFNHLRLQEAKMQLGASNWESAFAMAMQDAQADAPQAAIAKDARLNQERLGRLPIAMLILLPFLVYLAVMWRAHWDWRVPLVGLVVYNLVYNGLFFGRGFWWSLSMFNDENKIADFFTARTVDAMIALVLAALVVGILSRRQDAYATALNSIHAAFFIAGLLTLQILLYYVLYDVTLTWYIPDVAMGIKYYLDVLQTGAFWPLLYVPLMVILPFISLGARWVAARIPVGQVRTVSGVRG